jgi:hypothetical protein
MQSHSHSHPQPGAGSLDGTGAGDHDQPYVLGRRPRSNATGLFTMRLYLRLLVLRSRIAAGLFNDLDSRACTGGGES